VGGAIFRETFSRKLGHTYMKHDSSARRKIAPVVAGTTPIDCKLHLVPKHFADRASGKSRLEKQPLDANHWFYASDLFAIPFCLVWALGYYFTSGSGHDVTSPSIGHLFSTTTYHAAETVLRWGETLVRVIWSN